MAFRAGTNGQDLWPECRRFGIAIIEYRPVDDIDLSEYTIDDLPESWGDLGSPQKTSLRRFVFEMKRNDTIYVQSGPKIVGKGRVQSRYYFDHAGIVRFEGVPWQHQRKVKWLDVPAVENPTSQRIATVKPLTATDIQKIESQYDSFSADTPTPATESDIEGLRYEVVTTSSQRSRKLRDAAMRNSNGVCAVCDTDFSALLDGRGVRVLQVHHKRMLSQRKAPSETILTDLVVVCANCHLLLHLDPKTSLSVEKLRKMLGNSVRRRPR
jgi:hypothetical protein